MAAAGLPVIQVLLDDVNNGGTWPYNISAYLRLTEGLSYTTRGAADELSAPSPVTLTLTLDNTDSRFTLGTTGGGYGAINVDRGIRVLFTVNGVTTTRFTGFVQSWPTQWPAANDLLALSQITATDVMARWARRPLRSVIEEEILLDKPLWYYMLSEPAGSKTALDSSGNTAPTLLSNVYRGNYSSASPVVFGNATGPATDGLTAAQFSGGQYLTAYVPPVNWFTCAFLTTATSGSIVKADYGDAFGELSLYIDYSTQRLHGLWGNATTTVDVYSAKTINDGRTHAAAIFADPNTGILTLSLDGVITTATGAITAPPSNTSLVVGSVFTGTLSHVAGGLTLSDTIANRFTAFSSAMLTGFAGESSDTRVRRLANYEGSAPSYALDAGQTNVPFVDFTGKNVNDALQQVAVGEQGAVYADGQGRVMFHNRSRSPLRTTPDLVLAMSSDILDPSTKVEVDMQNVVNIASGTRDGDSTAVTQTVKSVASIASHGQYPASNGYLVTTDGEVFQRISWLMATHNAPAPRIPTLNLDLLTADVSVQASVMALDVDSRVQVSTWPAQSPTGATADLSIVGYSETLNLSTWTWSANTTSWLVTEQAAVLDDVNFGVLDVSARLGI